MLRLGSPLSTSASSLRSSSPLRRPSVPGSPSVLSKAKSASGKGRRRFTCWRCVAAGMLALVALLAAEQFSSRSLFIDFTTLDKLAEKPLQGVDGGAAEAGMALGGDPRLLEGRGRGALGGMGGALRMRLQEQQRRWGAGGMGMGQGFVGGETQRGFGGVQRGGEWRERMSQQQQELQQGGMHVQGRLVNGGLGNAGWQDGRRVQEQTRGNVQGFEQQRLQQQQQQLDVTQQHLQPQETQQQQQQQQQRGGDEVVREQGMQEENCDECRAEVNRLIGIYTAYAKRKAQLYGGRRRLFSLPPRLTGCLSQHLLANLSLLLSPSRTLRLPSSLSSETPAGERSVPSHAADMAPRISVADVDVPGRAAEERDGGRFLEDAGRSRGVEGRDGGEKRDGWAREGGGEGEEEEERGGEEDRKTNRLRSEEGFFGGDEREEVIGEGGLADPDTEGEGEAGMGGGGRHLLKTSGVEVLQAKLVNVQGDVDDLKAKIDALKASMEEAAAAMQRTEDLLYEQGEWAPRFLTEKANNRTVAMLEQQCFLDVRDKAGNAVAQQNMPPERPASWKGYYCQASPAELGKYHKYRPHRQCPDDWFFVQDLLYTKDCFDLPIRKCFARAPTKPSEPLPFPQSLFDQRALKDENVRWGSHHCKSFACLNARALGDCRNCFNLTLEGYRWQRAYRGSHTMSEVIKRKRGRLRLGLDAGGGSGSFAAHMALHNVTVLTTAMNSETVNGNYGGLPYMETIALRGLIPLFVPHKARLPFFDNTLDIIHSVNSVKYLPILDFEELVFEWDRVLRPGGIIWFEMFYAPMDEMPLYVSVINFLGYRKLDWRFSPKPESGERKGFHLYLNALLEKPARADPGTATTAGKTGTVAGSGAASAAGATVAVGGGGGVKKPAMSTAKKAARGGGGKAGPDRRKGVSAGGDAKAGRKGAEREIVSKGGAAVAAAAGGQGGGAAGAKGKKGGVAVASKGRAVAGKAASIGAGVGKGSAATGKGAPVGKKVASNVGVASRKIVKKSAAAQNKGGKGKLVGKKGGKASQ